MRYLGYRLGDNGKLSHKVHLNNVEEFNEWANDSYSKGWPTLKIASLLTGEDRVEFVLSFEIVSRN